MRRMATSGAPSVATPRELLLHRAVDWLARHGIGDTSLRTLATAIGSSHRMLIYHFGSREGLLTAVVDEAWRRHRQAFEALGSAEDPAAAAWGFWVRLADQAGVAGLYFELSAAAMQGHAWAVAPVRAQMQEWTQVLTRFFEQLGNPHPEALHLARTSMVVTRGALERLAVDGDREAADAVVRGYLEALLRGPA